MEGRSFDADDAHVLLEGVHLAAEGVAADVDVHEREVGPVEVGRLLREHDGAGAGAPDGQAVEAEAADGLAQVVDVEQARDRRALAAGDDEAVDLGELRRQPDLDGVRAETFEHRDVLGEVALQGEHADREERSFAHGNEHARGQSCGPRWFHVVVQAATRRPESRRSKEAPTSLRAACTSGDFAMTRPASLTAASTRCASGSTGCGARKPSSMQPCSIAIDCAERVAVLDLAPAVPAQHGWTVDEDDLLHVAVEAGVEEGVAGAEQAAPGVGLRIDAGADLHHEALLDVLEDRLEQRALVLEVVVEGAAGHASLPDQLLGGRVRVAPLGEEAAGDGHEFGAG